MHNKLARIFEARDERALFWLSRFFEERERFFQGNAELHSGYLKLFEDMMTPSWNNFAEADVAFLRAVAYYEFNYFKRNRLEVIIFFPGFIVFPFKQILAYPLKVLSIYN